MRMEAIKETKDPREQAKLEKLRSQRRDFVTNVVLIVNSFFEYGFRNQSKEKDSQNDDLDHYGGLEEQKDEY